MAKSVGNDRVYQEDGTYAIDGTCYRDAVVLAATTAETYTLPANHNGVMVYFAANAAFYANEAATAAIPSTEITNGDAPDYNPTVRWYPKGTASISLIAPAATIIILTITHK